jgi:hypothetical protein
LVAHPASHERRHLDCGTAAAALIQPSLVVEQGHCLLRRLHVAAAVGDAAFPAPVVFGV